MTQLPSEEAGPGKDSEPRPRPTPLVSVVMPAFNAEATLDATLGSVVVQTFTDFEVIVCDDGSRDGSRAMAEAILSAGAVTDWTVLTLGGCGPGGSRNHGIRAARGDFIAFLDDDDTWDPRKLARCVEKLQAESLDLICHSESWLDEDGNRSERRYRDLFNPRVAPVVSLMRNNPFSTSAVVVRRDSLLQAGLFDETLPSAEDYDLWIRLLLLPGFRVGFIDEPLGVYLVREGSESSKIDRRLAALLSIGDRYKEVLSESSPLGALEPWMYLGKTYFTTGIRYVQQGIRLRGGLMAAKGFAMWPFRFDWVIQALKRRQRPGAEARVGDGPSGGTAE